MKKGYKVEVIENGRAFGKYARSFLLLAMLLVRNIDTN